MCDGNISSHGNPAALGPPYMNIYTDGYCDVSLLSRQQECPALGYYAF